MLAMDFTYTPLDSVSVTTLSFRVASINDRGAKAVIIGLLSMIALTGNWAPSAAPLYPTTASAPILKVSVAWVSKSSHQISV